MQSRRLLLRVVFAVMSTSCFIRFQTIGVQAFAPDILRSLAASFAGISARASATPIPTAHRMSTSCRSFSERLKRVPQPRSRQSHRLELSPSSLSFSSSCRHPPPGEEGLSSSSSTAQTSSPNQAQILAGAGEGFGANSVSGAADHRISISNSQRQQSQQERRPKKQQQQRPKAPPRGKNLLVVGLGNPGDQYKLTRHNAGFLVAEELARRHGGTPKIRTTFQGEYCSISFKGKSVGILRPATFMNNSGVAARKVVDFFKLPINAAMILVDEVALDFGQLRLKGKGGPGGHNGLKSIQAHLKTPDYTRLRIGIGACGPGPLSDYVLGEFTRSEKRELDSVIAEACDAVECWIEEEDIDKVMTRFNGR